ncbi:MAG: hypothetical protein FJ387_02465 [Verrucomicrobia bacterium]|nr:hypothetical protein [Verrucomicrobiota bacterium]
MTAIAPVNLPLSADLSRLARRIKSQPLAWSESGVRTAFTGLRALAAAFAAQRAATPTYAQASALLREGGEAVRSAMVTLTSRLQASSSLADHATRGQPARLEGQVATLGAYSMRLATLRANGEPTPAATSTSPLGLDLTTPEAASALASDRSLGLDVTTPEAPSVLTSTAEINSATTSYGAAQIAFTKGVHLSTSLGNLSGMYRGTGAAANATALTLRIESSDTTIGATPTQVSVWVRDQNNTELGSYGGMVAAGQSLSLGADLGLSISFTAGTLLKNATSTLSVDRATPTHVDPNATFNHADANLRPRFENGQQVSAGSFTLNGVTIGVLANDSINTVLARINSLVPSVQATFSNDRITLTTTSPSEDDLALGGDTSGFLAAVKLAGATTSRGNLRDDTQVLAKTAQFGAVVRGAFTLNGVSILVDPQTDSLQSILGRINASAAGVLAIYDAGADQIRLTTVAHTEDLIAVESDTSGFLSAAGLATANTLRGNVRDDRQVLAKSPQFSGVTAGAFQVNGVSIAVDPSTDTLESLLARLNDSGAGVTASYQADTDRLHLEANAPDDSLVIDADSSGFLAAVHIPEGARRNRVNPDAPFNGTGANSPFLDPGRGVQDGAFVLNGVSIAVSASDSLNAVLARINASGAGVVATFNESTQRLALTRTAVGPAEISAGADSSGFLAAFRLDDTALSVAGSSTLDAPLATHPHFSGIRDGTITLNGQRVIVARALDSLADLASAIDDLKGIRASLDATSGRLVIQADATGAALEYEDDTGLFSLLGISRTAGRSGGLEDPTALAGAVSSGIGRLNEALRQLRQAPDLSLFLRYDIEQAVRTAVLSIPGGAHVGVGLTQRDGALQVSLDSAQLAETLSRDTTAGHTLVEALGPLPNALATALTAHDQARVAGERWTPVLGEATKAEADLLQSEWKLRLLHSTLGGLASLAFTPATGSDPRRDISDTASGWGPTPRVSGLSPPADRPLETAWALPAPRSSLEARVQTLYTRAASWPGLQRLLDAAA